MSSPVCELNRATWSNERMHLSQVHGESFRTRYTVSACMPGVVCDQPRDCSEIGEHLQYGMTLKGITAPRAAYTVDAGPSSLNDFPTRPLPYGAVHA